MATTNSEPTSEGLGENYLLGNVSSLDRHLHSRGLAVLNDPRQPKHQGLSRPKRALFAQLNLVLSDYLTLFKGLKCGPVFGGWVETQRMPHCGIGDREGRLLAVPFNLKLQRHCR